MAMSAVPLCDPGEAGFRELPGGQLTTGEGGRRIDHAEVGGIHDAWYTRPVARLVRDATFDLFRRRGLTTMFANPGSTEVPFLTGLPDDLRFVLGLHEGTVVGMASGYAIARGEPALVLLHTTAGLGTGVSGLATARVNRAPLVVVVGQQDRRHLAYEPFLAGRLD